MAVVGLIHININCSDYERSKAFYELLGFREFWQVPETSRPDIAAGLAMPPYRVKGALLRLEADHAHAGGQLPLTIDLLQWLEPHDDTPPYPHLYHYGIARIALTTDDFDGDVARLKAAGVTFISDPVKRSLDSGNPARFVCFKDPDGTVLEFLENPSTWG